MHYIRPDIFQVKRSIQVFGVWYALHRYGWRNLWTIFVATRMN